MSIHQSSNRSLLVVGSVAFDDIDGPFGHYPRILGGSASFFSTAASYFTSACSVVAVVGEDFPQEHLDFFESRGIDISGIEKAKGKTFFWKGKYSDDLNSRESLDTQLGVFGDFNPKLDATQRKCDLLFLGNIHPALQMSVLEQVDKPILVAADTMNFWIGGEREALGRTLEKVSTLVINDEEARELADEFNLVKAAEKIRGMGPSTVVIKRGDAGAMLFYEGGNFFAPALPLLEPKDPTGAGDSFAGGFMGYLASFRGEIGPEAIRTAMIYGSVMASFSVEQFSLDGLRGLNAKVISERFDMFRELSRFTHE
jgi:sugar/nucleoside kinase (ribokinase family)